MSTFTTRSGTTTCDRCNVPVGRNWQARAQHICPRTVADPFARHCENCGQPYSRTDKESNSNFKKRRFCGKSCATSHRRNQR